MKRVVITGATGAIGRALIKVCVDAGYEVLAVVHRASKRSAELRDIPLCRVMELDLDEYENAEYELKKQNIPADGYEIFFHLAWMAPFGSDRDDAVLQMKNADAALSAVSFAKLLGCSTFAGTGSQAEYGRVQGRLTPDTPAFPETGYGIAKLCAGAMTRLSCTQSGIKHVWCRVLSVYGPYDREQTLISTAVARMSENAATEFTPCDQMWDYIYSEDAARAILLAAQGGEHGRIYMIGSGQVRPLREYIELIASLTGYTNEIGFGKRPYNDKQVMYLQADISELEKLGFAVQVPFEDGIRRMLDEKRR